MTLCFFLFHAFHAVFKVQGQAHAQSLHQVIVYPMVNGGRDNRSVPGVSIFPTNIPYEQWGAGHGATNKVSQPSICSSSLSENHGLCNGQFFRAYFQGISPQNIAKNMVLTYLHFRILKFPLIYDLEYSPQES